MKTVLAVNMNVLFLGRAKKAIIANHQFAYSHFKFRRYMYEVV